MAGFKIRAGETRAHNTPARYLTVIESTGRFDIIVETLGVYIGETSTQIDLEGITRVEIANNSSEDIDILFENTNRPSQRNNAAVTVTNDLNINEIRGFGDGIAINANITEIERVGITSSNTLAALAQVTVPANTARQIVAARNAVGRTVTIQTLSEQETTLHIGQNNQVNATRGVILRGSKGTLSSTEVKTTTAVYVYNDTDTDAIVGAMEQYTA